jgi:hypothetical protein
MLPLRKRVNAELAALVDQHGTLKQEHVVEAARKKRTALYEEFDRQGLWSDEKAAERARLEFAGRLIRIYMIRISDDQASPVRALVSISDDRRPGSDLPGYRRIQDVLKDPTLREQLVATALMELRACQRRYAELKELAAVWAALDEVHTRARVRSTRQARQRTASHG